MSIPRREGNRSPKYSEWGLGAVVWGSPPGNKAKPFRLVLLSKFDIVFGELLRSFQEELQEPRLWGGVVLLSGAELTNLPTPRAVLLRLEQTTSLSVMLTGDMFCFAVGLLFAAFPVSLLHSRKMFGFSLTILEAPVCY